MVNLRVRLSVFPEISDSAPADCVPSSNPNSPLDLAVEFCSDSEGEASVRLRLHWNKVRWGVELRRGQSWMREEAGRGVEEGEGNQNVVIERGIGEENISVTTLVFCALTGTNQISLESRTGPRPPRGRGWGEGGRRRNPTLLFFCADICFPSTTFYSSFQPAARVSSSLVFVFLSPQRRTAPTRVVT